jgi:hypothetical protein
MKIFFGTVIRNAPVRKGGELVKLDWQNKKIEAKVSIFPSNPSVDFDPNPRGNTRGCRGIKILADRLIVANYHTLQIYNLQLCHQNDITHKLMVGLHETYLSEENKIWLSSTAIDAALEYDIETRKLTNQFWPREFSEFQKQLNIETLDIEKNVDQRANLKLMGDEHTKHRSHLHLNAIAQWNGETFALFNSFGIIANLNKRTIVIKDPALRGGHNLLILNDGTAIANDTIGRTIRFYNLSTSKLIQVIELLNFSWVQSWKKKANFQNQVKRSLKKLGLFKSALARPLFLRGLDLVEDLIFVGISPASILCINWQTKKLIDVYSYSQNINACIHGIKVLLD